MTTGSDEAVIVHVKLLGGDFGDEAELARLDDLELRLEEAVGTIDAAEYDGHDIGDGFFTIYCYGPEAELLANAVLPLLDSFRPPPGSYAEVRHGPPGAAERRVEW